MENNEKLSEETIKNWRADPKNWKFGVFYYNKEDKRLFPPKRFPFLGWTINFANPYSIITMSFIIVLCVVVAIILKKYF